MDAFATMLNRNTNIITHTLQYAILEWTLIFLLLLNSLLQYLIVKFANYYGLKPPCLWCSRIDHFLEPRKCGNLYRDLLCKAHCKEISELVYCSIHQKLAEYHSMCEDCLSSRSNFCGLSEKLNFFPCVKATGMIYNGEAMVIDNREKVPLECSCCGVSLKRQIYSPYDLINHLNWHDTKNENLITEEGENNDYSTKDDSSYRTRIDFVIEQFKDDHGFKRKGEKQMSGGVLDLKTEKLSGLKTEKNKEQVFLEAENELNEEDSGNTIKDLISSDETVYRYCRERDASLDLQQQHLEFLIDFSGQHLVPVELRSLATEHREVHLGSEIDIATQVVSDLEHIEENNEFVEVEETANPLFLHAKECDLVYEQLNHIDVQGTEANFLGVSEEVSNMQNDNTELEASIRTKIAFIDCKEREWDAATANEELSPFIMSDTETEVSIGTEIPDLNTTKETYPGDGNCIHGEASASCTDFHAHHEHVELRTLMIELSDHKINSQVPVYMGINRNGEEIMCCTPNSSDGYFHEHKTLLFCDRRDSGDEEYLPESVASECDCKIMTVERLNSALRAERKALNIVYAELEEERNASAIAANQTMAMINRLQEEKAAMQMEALHYQRMMEEKSEYDEEAMQIMNDLVVKKDRERQRLEKELEICRKKLLDCKDESARGGYLSVSCSNEDDSDEIFISLNQESKEENGNLSAPLDSDLYFGDPLGDFEEQRMSIIDQLKILEDKLCTMFENEQHFGDVRPSCRESVIHFERSFDISGEEVDQLPTIYSNEMNGKYYKQGTIGTKTNTIPPLYNAVSKVYENEEFNVHDDGFDRAVARFELEDRRAAMKEEVDQLYARMNAIETDKELLKQCIGSLKNGDKAMDLHEVLHHLLI